MVNFNPRFLHLFSLFICCLILIDSLYSPLKKEDEHVLNYECNVASYGRYRPDARNFITTNRHSYDLSLTYCLNLDSGEYITVSRSAISNSLGAIIVHKPEGSFEYDVSFFSGRAGWLYVSGIGFLSLLFFLFFKSLGNETGRHTMIYFLLVCSIALLLQHTLNFF